MLIAIEFSSCRVRERHTLLQLIVAQGEEWSERSSNDATNTCSNIKNELKLAAHGTFRPRSQKKWYYNGRTSRTASYGPEMEEV